MYELNWLGKLLFVIPITFIAITMIGVYCHTSLEPFLRKRKMIMMELSRATPSRKSFWKKKLYKNSLRLIPIVGAFMKKKKTGYRHFRRHRRHRHHRNHKQYGFYGYHR